MTASKWTSDELLARLHAALDLVRDPGKNLEIREHVLILFFLKRLNDLYEEHYLELLQQQLASGKSESQAHAVASDPDEHRFVIPLDSRWSLLMEAGDDVHLRVKKACQALENENARLLSRVLNALDWTVLGVGRESMIPKLLAHFDGISLRSREGAAPEAVGDACDSYVNELIALRRRGRNEYALPPQLIKLMVELLQPEEGMRICDPFCASGSSLIACGRYVRDRGGNARNLTLSGQQIATDIWRLCKINMLLNDFPDSKIWEGDAITDPSQDPDGRLMKFDMILTQLPLTAQNWNREGAVMDRWDRFTAGVPSAKRGEFAFVQHIAAALNDRGRAAAIVPHGILFRSGVEGNIRTAMLQPESDLIEAVIGLPSKLLHGSNMPSAILVLNRNKPAERRGKVMFLHASPIISRPGSPTALLDDEIITIVAAYRGFAIPKVASQFAVQLASEWEQRSSPVPLKPAEKPGVAHLPKAHGAFKSTEAAWNKKLAKLQRLATVATLQEISERHGFNLNLARYVSAIEEIRHLDVGSELKILREMEANRNALEAEMDAVIHEMGYL